MAKRKIYSVYLPDELQKRMEEYKEKYDTCSSKLFARALDQFFKRMDQNKAAYADLLSEGKD
jgi:predicted transcriptional regulator